MMFTHRQKKQIIIGSIYLIIFIGTIVGGYFVFKPKLTCFDGVQNQGELGIDCGGPCSPCAPKVAAPVIEDQQLVQEGNGIYEFVAKIKNQSQVYGNSKIDYQINLYNDSNQIIKTINQNTFILSGEEKYIVKPAIRIDRSNIISRTEMKITHLGKWEKMDQAVYPDLMVKNKKIEILAQSNKYAEVSGTIINRADVGFQKVMVNIILFGEENKVVRANQTEIRTLTAGQERFFSVFWNKPFISQKFHLIVEPVTNPFDQDNIIVEGSK
ncbi:MAG TPA: hypothetical protein ENL06_03730 [Candidatus Portnoybacteria bacterium]|nr:hypothetical protein [Candidatus Portnoybacteria bacterium]